MIVTMNRLIARCGAGRTTSTRRYIAMGRGSSFTIMYRPFVPQIVYNSKGSMRTSKVSSDRITTASVRRSFGISTNEHDAKTSQHHNVTIPDTSSLWEAMSPHAQELAQALLQARRRLEDVHSEDPTMLPTTTAAEEVDTASAHTTTAMSERIHPRVALSRAITLMESKHPGKKTQGDLLLTYLLSKKEEEGADNEDGVPPATTNAPTLRVGFAGPPGAGKSSLMEAFGVHLLQEDPNLKLAVVCIDPSSHVSGGSILGDKTRMTELSRSDRAVVRPSSNSGILGGLAAYTDDVVRLMGCAGYPVVFVETVGLGQSEIEVAQSVDVLVLLIPPSGGDGLQGVKKGIVEMANILAVTKADGDLEAAATRTATDYSGALQILQSASSRDCDADRNDGGASPVWKPPVLLTSAVSKRGLEDLWRAIVRYQQYLIETGMWEKRRQRQAKYWMWQQFTRMMQIRMQQDPALAERAHRLESQMLKGLLTPRVAAQELLDGVFQLASERNIQ
jgi:LAO/AO transport system kinase